MRIEVYGSPGKIGVALEYVELESIVLLHQLIIFNGPIRATVFAENRLTNHLQIA